MKRQTSLQLIGYINKYGCMFMVEAYWFPLVVNGVEATYNQINRLWMKALDAGWMTGDLNQDDDMDDPDELLLKDTGKNLLLVEVGLHYKYAGSIGPEQSIPHSCIAMGQFYNARTDFTHYVGLNRDKSVGYDPIRNSVTVREGRLVAIRLFEPA